MKICCYNFTEEIVMENSNLKILLFWIFQLDYFFTFLGRDMLCKPFYPEIRFSRVLLNTTVSEFALYNHTIYAKKEDQYYHSEKYSIQR